MYSSSTLKNNTALFPCVTQGEASGFEACARALLGEAGRAGRVNAAVGVMQVGGWVFTLAGSVFDYLLMWLLHMTEYQPLL